MTDGRGAERARLDALMYRMLGAVLLFGSAVLLGLLFLLLGLPRVVIDGRAMLLLPGMEGRHGLSEAALPVVGSGMLLLGLSGLAALALARRPVRFGAGPRQNTRRPSFRRPAYVLLAGVAVLVAVLLRR